MKCMYDLMNSEDHNDLKKIMAAHQLINKHHKNQMYGDKPYIYHLIGVADLYYDIYGYDIDAITVCLLHDILEDTQCERSALIAVFGDLITESIDVLTKQKHVTYNQYLNNIMTNELARKVKYCDSLFNLNSCLKNGINQPNTLYQRYLGNIRKLIEGNINA